RRLVIGHLKKVISAAPRIGVRQVNTFIGRDPAKSIEANWPAFLEVWPDIIQHAEIEGVNLGIENCPMLFTQDEWPGGKNLAVSPAIWRRMFEALPSDNFGLNYDPSHMIWQQMDEIQPIDDFAQKLFHVHAKDARVDLRRLNDC